MKRLFPAALFVLFCLVSAPAQLAQEGRQTDTANPAAASDSRTQSSGSPTQEGAATQEKKSTPGQEAAATGPESAEASQPRTPHTDLNQSPDTGVLDAGMDPGPLPNNKLTLIGGTAKKVDSVRNRLLIQPFGGGPEVKVLFDERTHIYRDGRRTTLLGIHRGDRVYVDTMTLGPQVFARTIRVETGSGPAEAHGQVVEFDPESHVLRMRDTLTSQIVSFRVTDQTKLQKKNGSATVGDLMPGTLLEAVFPPGGKRGTAQQIHILAVPGTRYTFLGLVTNIDLSRGVLALDNASDANNYELRFDAPLVADRAKLVIGATISADTKFDGRGYFADSITLIRPVPDNAAR